MREGRGEGCRDLLVSGTKRAQLVFFLSLAVALFLAIKNSASRMADPSAATFLFSIKKERISDEIRSCGGVREIRTPAPV